MVQVQTPSSTKVYALDSLTLNKEAQRLIHSISFILILALSSERNQFNFFLNLGKIFFFFIIYIN
ncbi:hypothetical protein HOB94_00575 [bacterium]|nr:hypothetical protein [bacterium]MBT6778687.1 hypothetical protein [bacterium]